MHPTHIAELVREALTLSGCTDEQIGQFDGHSTIELEFIDLPSLNISLLDTGVWFWSSLTQFTSAARSHHAEALLAFLMRGFEPARTEQLQLTEIDGALELRVLLGDDASASAEGMSMAIEAYVERLHLLKDTLR